MNADSLKLLIPLATITRLAGFEVQRWARSRAEGKRGASEGFGLFIDLSSNLSSLVYFGWVIFVGLRIGVLEAAIIFLSSMALVMLLGFASGPDRFWKWMLGLVLIWPLIATLFVIVASK